MRPIEDNEFDIFINGEDAPQIAGIVDERGPVDFTDKRRWKIIADSQDGDLTITSQYRENKQSTNITNDSDNDLSPPRKESKRHTNLYNKNSQRNRDSDSDSDPDIPVRALRAKTEAYKKRDVKNSSKLSKEVPGVAQAVVLRDSKTGRKRNLEAEAAEEREKQKRQTELNEKYAKWGKGLKQVEDREEKLKDDLYEMSKPLARYADDVDLDKRLREQEREGDPMLEYIKQKQIKEGKRKPDRPTYEGSYMPNRFGIKPGYRWDGVDRSNGYEKRWFEAQNAKTALQEEAYKWSTSDM
ncbi:BUD13 homolog isoform X2 [Halictus rubicundus]